MVIEGKLRDTRRIVTWHETRMRDAGFSGRDETATENLQERKRNCSQIERSTEEEYDEERERESQRGMNRSAEQATNPLTRQKVRLYPRGRVIRRFVVRSNDEDETTASTRRLGDKSTRSPTHC